MTISAIKSFLCTGWNPVFLDEIRKKCPEEIFNIWRRCFPTDIPNREQAINDFIREHNFQTLEDVLLFLKPKFGSENFEIKSLNFQRLLEDYESECVHNYVVRMAKKPEDSVEGIWERSKLVKEAW
jgi:hypothetical protein